MGYVKETYRCVNTGAHTSLQPAQPLSTPLHICNLEGNAGKQVNSIERFFIVGIVSHTCGPISSKIDGMCGGGSGYGDGLTIPVRGEVIKMLGYMITIYSGTVML